MALELLPPLDQQGTAVDDNEGKQGERCATEHRGEGKGRDAKTRGQE